MDEQQKKCCFLRVRQVAAMFGISVPTVWRWVKQGTLPAAYKIGPRVTVWNLAELENVQDQIMGGCHAA